MESINITNARRNALASRLGQLGRIPFHIATAGVYRLVIRLVYRRAGVNAGGRADARAGASTRCSAGGRAGARV